MLEKARTAALQILEQALQEQKRRMLALDPLGDHYHAEAHGAERVLARMLRLREALKQAPGQETVAALAALDPTSLHFEGDLFAILHPGEDRAAPDHLCREWTNLLTQLAALEPGEPSFHSRLFRPKTNPEAEAIAQLEPSGEDFEGSLFQLSNEPTPLNRRKAALIVELSKRAVRSLEGGENLWGTLDAILRLIRGIKDAPDLESAEKVARRARELIR